MNKLILNLAPTGIVPTKKSTPNVPIFPKEIIDDVIKCSNLGVSMVHVHARDINGNPTYKKEIYEEIFNGIRSVNSDIILIASTSGRNFPDISNRSEVLFLEDKLKPDMASLTLSSMNFLRNASINSPDNIIKLASIMNERGIKPELEVFDLGMINYSKYLIKKGILKPPYYFNIFLGNISSAQANLSHLGLLISELPENSYFSITGIGEFQHSMTALSTIIADGVRIGIEDNIWYDKEDGILATNENLVKRIINIASAYNREVASPLEVRDMLNIK